jgi:ATP-binding cassette subfamily B multidrug efflux pump
LELLKRNIQIRKLIIEWNPLNNLLPFLKPYWKMVVLAPLLMLVEVIANLFQPILLAKVIDVGIVQHDLTSTMRTSLIMIGFATISLVGGVGCTIVASIASQSFGADLRFDLFKKIQNSSYSFLNIFKTSSLITRLTNDIPRVQALVLASLRIMVRAPLLCIGGIIMTISISARLSLILLSIMPVLLYITVILIQKSFPRFITIQKRLDRVNTIIRENLSGARLIKIFVRASLEKNRFSVANQELMTTTVEANKIVILIMPVIMLIMNLSVVAVIWIGGLQVNSGTMKIGEVIAVINYFIQILFSLKTMNHFFVLIPRARASAERIYEVLSSKTDIQSDIQIDSSPLISGRITFENVTFSYNGKKEDPVLKDISFTAQTGETIAILGTIGSGKSTLVSLIPRLYDVNQGRILIDGRDVRTIDLIMLRSLIGMVFQDSILFSETIKENLKWGNDKASDQEIFAATQIAQIHEFIQSLPKGYDTPVNQRGVNLSGGQKQRLAIARAILKKPLILILDDSTSMVDLITEKHILKALKLSLNHMTTFIVTQRISTVIDVDHILLLDNGRISNQGSPSDLLKSSGMYREFYWSQFEEKVINRE